jgi:hypothetical protein
MAQRSDKMRQKLRGIEGLRGGEMYKGIHVWEEKERQGSDMKVASKHYTVWGVRCI